MRVRLTVWYALILLATFVATGAGTWMAVRDSIHDTVDGELRTRLAFWRSELAEEVALGRSANLERWLENQPAMAPGTQVEIAEGDRWIYQSPDARDWGARTPGVSRLPAEGQTRTVMTPARDAVRVLTAPAGVVGAPGWVVEIGVPVNEFYEPLDQLVWTVLVASPIALLLASAGGYWMSRSALEPVDRMTRTARAISAQNLAERLPLRGADDELDRLAQTLNEMFGRLDAGFRRVAQFTADASHELRTPLAIIRTTAELARRRARTEAEYEAALDRILADSERATRLIDDLLLLSRSDAGADQALGEAMDLVVPVRDACAWGEVRARASALSFTVELPATCPATGESEAVCRLVASLIDNAIKYTPSGGVVRVGMRVEGAEAVIAVSDTGIGIPRVDQPHLFERFYRVGTDRSRATGGAGLGLSIARLIAMRHRGTIHVDSELGRGSTFSVRLPIVVGVVP